MDLQVRNPQTLTELVPGPDSSDCPHTVLKVGRLFSNEAWILDAAGCQYGFREVLVPYELYLADKLCRISNEPTTYDANETKDLDHFSTLPFRNKTRAQREDLELERQASLHFAVFVKTRVEKNILNGSVAVFKDNLSSFAHDTRSHMFNLDAKANCMR